jgi:hypothetical protein
MSTSVKAKFNSRRGSVEANLPVLFFEDNGVSIVHCPALDLSGYGKTEDEARSSFELVLEEFFDYTLKKSSLLRVLRKLGWEAHGKRSRRRVTAPSLEEMMDRDPELNLLLANTPVRIQNRPVYMPVAA